MKLGYDSLIMGSNNYNNTSAYPKHNHELVICNNNCSTVTFNNTCAPI